MPEEEDSLRRLIQDNLERLIPILGGVILATALGAIAPVPSWAKMVAALLTLVAVVLLVLWLPRPKAAWNRSMGASLVLVLAAAVGILLVGLLLRPDSKPERELTADASVLLLDGSRQMAETMRDGVTKMDAARAALTNEVGRNIEGEQLGLVTAGIEVCSAGEPAHIIEVGKNNSGRIRKEAASVKPDGQSNLGEAIGRSVRMLSAFQNHRSVVAIIGGLDQCQFPLSRAFADAKGRGVNLRWQIIGLALSEDEKGTLEAVSSEDVVVRLADSRDDAVRAVSNALLDARYGAELGELNTFIEDEMRPALNDASRALQRRDLQVARDRLDEVTQQIANGEANFRSLLIREPQPQVRPLAQLLKDQFERLRDAKGVLEQIATFDRENPEGTESAVKERDALIHRWNRVVGEYNAEIPDVAAAAERVLNNIEPR